MRQSVIYIYPASTSFVRKDIELLSESVDIIEPKHDWLNKSLAPVNFVRQFFFLVLKIRKCSCVFVMFGGYWSLLPALFGRLTGKSVYVILGGTDCVSFPSLGYGSLRKPLLKLFIKWSYQWCTKLLPVDEALVYCDYSYHEPRDYPHQGYRYFFPSVATPHQIIHNGFDDQQFDGGDTQKIKNTFITVAPIYDEVRWKLKGIDRIVELAEVYPLYTFKVVGVSDEIKKRNTSLPSNVSLLSFQEQDVLKKHLFTSEFYLQLSVSEGFPNALGEGMLCKCIPIGSAVGGIPHIIGKAGFVVSRSDLQTIRSVFDSLDKLDEATRIELGEAARRRIVENFPLSKRKQLLIDLIPKA